MNFTNNINNPANPQIAYYPTTGNNPTGSEHEKKPTMQINGHTLPGGEEWYHKMVEEVEDYAILLLDVNGIIQNWNKGAEKIKGYKESEIVGKSFTLFYPEEDRTSGLPERLLHEAAVKGKAIQEGWRVRKGGSYFWGSVVITSLHDEANNVIGFSKVTRDLTERKRIENQLRHYASDLEFQNKELQQFTYAAAHDMKEPLRKVQFYNSLVVEKCADLLPERERNYLGRSVEAAVRMQRLIDDLLTYANTTNGSEQLIPTDLNALVKEVCNNLEEVTGDDPVTFNIQPLPEVRVVPFQLSQVFSNIIGNAIKYKHPDKPAVITVSNTVVHTTPLQETPTGSRYNKITITDNGIGFEQEYADKIFELFMRLHDKSRYPGTGIGLAICKKIVQQHKGEIYAEGHPMEGSVFTIYLPEYQAV